jgi:hypothetical protein
MTFLNDIHKDNFYKLFTQAAIHSCDNERIALFYIISGNNDLFKKKYFIYDFNENTLKFFSFKQTKIDFCSSSKSLIRLALNLFNGYSDKYTNPLNLLSQLTYDNYDLAINAIKIRFNFY